MAKKTPLYESHQALGASMVEFAGFDMPLHYGSQIAEHHQVRKAAGMFDVSHMGVIEVKGETAPILLRRLLANNIDKLTNFRALYSCMLNEAGGIIDDLIIYQISPEHYLLVVNAATKNKDLEWIRKQSHITTLKNINIELRTNMAIIAVQGPLAREKIVHAMPFVQEAIQSLKPFQFLWVEQLSAQPWLISNTGYTGEEGFEIILPEDCAQPLWQALLKAGIHPIGLGARDTLRLEAGLNLYGLDMDESTTPLESNLAWTVAFEPQTRSFIGREALEEIRQTGSMHTLVGLILQDKGVLRHDQIVYCGTRKLGHVTSGTHSPTLGVSIALARLELPITEDCEVEIRGKKLRAKIVKPPFVRRSA